MSYLDDIRLFILNWDVNNPVDHWWRTRFNVPFGSPQHLDMDMIDMRVSFEESQMYKRLNEERERRKEEEDNKELGFDVPGSGNIVNMSKVEIDKEFEELDIKNLNG